MNLFVPEIGSKLKLTSDWTFILYSEYRNEKNVCCNRKEILLGG